VYERENCYAVYQLIIPKTRVSFNSQRPSTSLIEGSFFCRIFLLYAAKMENMRKVVGQDVYRMYEFNYTESTFLDLLPTMVSSISMFVLLKADSESGAMFCINCNALL